MLIVLVVATAHAAVSPLPMIWNDTFIGRDRPGQVAADQRICRAQRRAYASLFRKASIPDKTIHIVALGGSMVVGIDTRCGKACAYPAYFARWLAARSAASVELENRAAGGMTSATALPVLGSLVRPLHGQNSPDLVLVDFGMNNAWSELTAADVFGATEAQLRVLLMRFPEIAVAVIQVNGGCAAAPCLDDAKAAAVARACLHYGVPYLSYRRLLRPGTYGFEAWGGPELVSRPHHPKSILDRCPPHPPESVHTRVATVVALWWEGLEVRAAQWIPPRGGGWAVRQPSIANSFGEACVDLLATYDAVLGHSRAPLGLDASGWTIDQRRADKRGWQATAVGAAISFPLEFGPDPHVMITYTKGYDRFGNVRVTIPPSNRSFVLSGCCRTESVTQEKLAIARVGGNKFNDYYSDSSDGTVAFLDLGFQVPSFSSRELRLEIVSPTGHNRTTFRVNSVSSC